MPPARNRHQNRHQIITALRLDTKTIWLGLGTKSPWLGLGQDHVHG